MLMHPTSYRAAYLRLFSLFGIMQPNYNNAAGFRLCTLTLLPFIQPTSVSAAYFRSGSLLPILQPTSDYAADFRSCSLLPIMQPTSDHAAYSLFCSPLPIMNLNLNYVYDAYTRLWSQLLIRPTTYAPAAHCTSRCPLTSPPPNTKSTSAMFYSIHP